MVLCVTQQGKAQGFDSLRPLLRLYRGLPKWGKRLLSLRKISGSAARDSFTEAVIGQCMPWPGTKRPRLSTAFEWAIDTYHGKGRTCPCEEVTK